MSAEEIYDAAEMRDGKGFSYEGHRAGLAAVAAAAKTEQRETDARIVDDSADRLESLADGEELTDDEKVDAYEAVQMLRRTARAVREAVQS